MCLCGRDSGVLLGPCVFVLVLTCVEAHFLAGNKCLENQSQNNLW